MEELNSIRFIFFTHRRKFGESQLRFKKHERNFYRLRDKKYPKRPETDKQIRNALTSDPKIRDKYAKTLDNQRLLYVDSVVKKKQYAFHLFASVATVDLIKQHIPPDQRKYLADGTFRVAPRRFSTKGGQLLIISIEYKNDVGIFRYFNTFQKRLIKYSFQSQSFIKFSSSKCVTWKFPLKFDLLYFLAFVT